MNNVVDCPMSMDPRHQPIRFRLILLCLGSGLALNQCGFIEKKDIGDDTTFRRNSAQSNSSATHLGSLLDSSLERELTLPEVEKFISDLENDVLSNLSKIRVKDGKIKAQHFYQIQNLVLKEPNKLKQQDIQTILNLLSVITCEPTTELHIDTVRKFFTKLHERKKHLHTILASYSGLHQSMKFGGLGLDALKPGFWNAVSQLIQIDERKYCGKVGVSEGELQHLLRGVQNFAHVPSSDKISQNLSTFYRSFSILTGEKDFLLRENILHSFRKLLAGLSHVLELRAQYQREDWDKREANKELLKNQYSIPEKKLRFVQNKLTATLAEFFNDFLLLSPGKRITQSQLEGIFTELSKNSAFPSHIDPNQFTPLLLRLFAPLQDGKVATYFDQNAIKMFQDNLNYILGDQIDLAAAVYVKNIELEQIPESTQKFPSLYTWTMKEKNFLNEFAYWCEKEQEYRCHKPNVRYIEFSTLRWARLTYTLSTILLKSFDYNENNSVELRVRNATNNEHKEFFDMTLEIANALYNLASVSDTNDESNRHHDSNSKIDEKNKKQLSSKSIQNIRKLLSAVFESLSETVLVHSTNDMALDVYEANEILIRSSLLFQAAQEASYFSDYQAMFEEEESEDFASEWRRDTFLFSLKYNGVADALGLQAHLWGNIRDLPDVETYPPYIFSERYFKVVDNNKLKNKNQSQVLPYTLFVLSAQLLQAHQTKNPTAFPSYGYMNYKASVAWLDDVLKKLMPTLNSFKRSVGIKLLLHGKTDLLISLVNKDDAAKWQEVAMSMMNLNPKVLPNHEIVTHLFEVIHGITLHKMRKN